MTALNTAEDTGKLDDLLALHAEDVTLRNMTTQTWKGKDGAREFWQRYLSDFSEIHSDFTHHADMDSFGVMEWNAKGQLKDGQKIDYRGVSLIETDGQKVKAFRTYYDSAAFIKPAS